MSGVPAGALLAIGETMAMVAPVDGSPVVGAEAFLMDAGGAESNVAAHAAALGIPARWHSRLGEDALGRRVARQLAARGIDTSSVEFDPARPTGLYVKDPGDGVLYYRRGSAASGLDETDAGAVPLAGVAVLHVSGVTAAISDSARRFLMAIMRRARAAGITVSFDVNHRAPLWPAAEAAPVLAGLAASADIVFVGRDEAETLWGTVTAQDVRHRLPDVPELVVKDGAVGATCFAGDEEWFEASQRVEVVDVVGAGDAFAGGYLAARLLGADVPGRLRAGHERAALTLRTLGDSLADGAHDLPDAAPAGSASERTTP
ncbi:MAG: sugar kinase [Microbacterium sp.]|uniref:sugar kinase n=1 Tax=Microbacterium sp. TaxID=51671 RepID=UPI0039E6829A